MHTRASNSELVEPLPEPEHALNRRLRRQNIRVPYDQRNNPPQHPRIVYPPVLNINYFRHFLNILQNYDPMDDEPMWAADHVIALTPGSAITIPETANEFAIKCNHLTLVKGNQFHGRTKTDPHKHIHEFLKICNMFKYRDTENKVVRLMMFPLSLTREAKTWLDELNEGTIETWDELRTAFISLFFPPALFNRLLEEIRAFSQHENESLTDAWLYMKEMLQNCHGHNLSKGNTIKIFYHGLSEITQEVLNAAAGGSSNSNTDKIMARMDAMTLKMDAQYKELQAHAKKRKPDLDEDNIPMSREEESKFMQTFRKTRFYNDYRDRDSNRDSWRSNERSSYNRDNYRSNIDDKPYDLQKQFNYFMKSQQSTNAFVKETFMDLKTQLETVAKNHQASIQNLETKFDRLPDKQFGRPSGSLPSNTQLNPKAHNSKAYQPPQSQNEHVNAVFTRSGKSYNPPVNPNDQQNDYETPINFDSDYEDDEPTPQTKTQNPKSVKETMLPKPCKPKIPYPQRLRKEKMEAQYGKFIDMIRAVRINVPLIDKQLNLGVGTEWIIFNIDSAMKHSYSNDDTCFSINVINEILEEDLDALLDEGSKILYSIKGTLLEEEIFAEFDEFMVMTADENSDSESDTEDPPFEKITINIDYKIKTSLEEPHKDLELKPLPDIMEYVFLKEPSFLPVIISSQLSKENKNKLVSVLKKHKQAFAWKTTYIPGICPSFCMTRNPLSKTKKVKSEHAGSC
ncbi:reverse transcriptase domain-containing protein [Tanacetum coccineum]